MNYRLILIPMIAVLLAGCLFLPGGRDVDKREYITGLHGEKLYIGRAIGQGESYGEAMEQALLVAASQAVGVEFEHIREYNGKRYFENTRTRIRAVNHEIEILEQRQLDNGQKMVRIYGLFQPLSEIPLSQ